MGRKKRNALAQSTMNQMQAKIILLQILNDTPSPAADNVFQNSTGSGAASEHRVLSFQKEKELVETLAFIAATTDDPSKVIALCVEEAEGGKGMIIKLAVNNGGLERVLGGFRLIASTLEAIFKHGRAHIDQEKKLVRAIVRLNRNRILCRVRSQHAVLKCNFKRSKKDKPKVIITLIGAFLKAHPIASSTSSTRLHDLRRAMEEIHLLFVELELLTEAAAKSTPGEELLLGIVEASLKIYRSKEWASAIPSLGSNRAARTCMAQTILKLSRYPVAARHLSRGAVTFPIFASIQVTAIQVPRPPPRPIQNPDAFLLGVIESTFCGVEAAQNARTTIEARLEAKDKKLSDLCAITSSTKAILHAEIQLLAHYESHIPRYPPRIICSSKKACFLCNLFLRLHGKFFVPSTHGVLYEKWTIPAQWVGLEARNIGDIQSTVARFEAMLNELLQHEILTPTKPLPRPQESMIFQSTMSSVASILDAGSFLPAADSGYEEIENVTSTEIAIDGPPLLLTGPAPQSLGHVSLQSPHLSTEAVPDIVGEKPGTTIIQTAALGTVAKSSPVGARNTADIKGATTHHASLYVGNQVQTIKLLKTESQTLELSPQSPLVRVTTPRIHLTLSYEAWKHNISSISIVDYSQIRVACQITLKWLDISDIPLSEPAIIDLDDFPPDTQKTFNQFAGSCDFYIRRGIDAVSIKTAY